MLLVRSFSVLTLTLFTQSKPNNAPRRQLFKYKHDLHGTSRSSKRNQKPYSTSFALPLLGELNCSETPLDIALEQARREHQERTADKKRRREAREEERRKEIARLEKERRRLQKKKKRLTAGSTADENLATDGLAAVHTVPEEMPSPTTHESGLRFDSPSAPQYDSLEESDWSSNCFVEDWYADDNNHLSDHCDEEMAFTPYDDRIPMKDSVLLSTAIRENPVDEDASEEVEVAGATAGEMPVTPIQQGLEHILSSLGIPSSAREPFIQVRLFSSYLLATYTDALNLPYYRTWSKPFPSSLT